MLRVMGGTQKIRHVYNKRQRQAQIYENNLFRAARAVGKPFRQRRGRFFKHGVRKRRDPVFGRFQPKRIFIGQGARTGLGRVRAEFF